MDNANYKIYRVTANRRNGEWHTDSYYFLHKYIADICCEYLNLRREYWFERYGFDEYYEYFVEEIETYDMINFALHIEKMNEKINKDRKCSEEVARKEFFKSEEADEAFRKYELAKLARLKAKYE